VSTTAHAVLAGANSSTASGTVTYTVTAHDSDSDVVSTDVEPVVDGVVGDSKPVHLEAGEYSWQASYSGDALNQPSQSLVVVQHVPHHRHKCGHHRRLGE
jgi:hypothetical protein